MAAPGAYSNRQVWQLYNMIPTGGVATTARVELADASGVDFYTIASLTVPIAATNLYKAVSDWLTTNDAANKTTVLNRVVGGSIVCALEVRFNCSGANDAGTVNTPAPTTSSNQFWAAGTGYNFGIKVTA